MNAHHALRARVAALVLLALGFVTSTIAGLVVGMVIFAALAGAAALDIAGDILAPDEDGRS